MKPCANPHCAEPLTGPRRTLCRSCQRFWQRHGRHRTAADRHYRQTGLCQRCRRDEARARKLCRACYEYQRSKGRHRPAYLWRGVPGT